jgi:hypothetical protein
MQNSFAAAGSVSVDPLCDPIRTIVIRFQEDLQRDAQAAAQQVADTMTCRAVPSGGWHLPTTITRFIEGESE